MNNLLLPENLLSIWLWATLNVLAVGIPFYFYERQRGAGIVPLAVYTALAARLLLPIPAPWGS